MPMIVSILIEVQPGNDVLQVGTAWLLFHLIFKFQRFPFIFCVGAHAEQILSFNSTQ